MTTRFTESAAMYWARVALADSLAAPDVPQRGIYEMLEAYYQNNGLYQAVQAALYENGIWTPGMLGIRNPTNRVVEFYVSKLWPGMLPGALPIVTDNDRIIDPIYQVWAWSNWGTQKQLAARWFAMLGDWFVKVAVTEDNKRVYLQQIKATYVTELERDNRGYITYIRIDIPGQKKFDGNTKNFTTTEVWDKTTQMYYVWEHFRDYKAPVESLGTPNVARPFSDFGIDFIPVVQAQFRDIGEKRGQAAVWTALDKIDEADRMATRLHQMLFRYNKAVWALRANASDAAGRPLPAPRVGNGDGTSLDIRDDELFRLPGNSELEAMVPDIKYDAALSILNAMMTELEQDLPELGYYRIREAGGQLSGRAVRLLLGPAVDRVLEARGNAESALARADMMAITIGQKLGIFPVSVGSYESGDLYHEFADRPVIDTSEFEDAETVKALVSAGVPLVTSVRRVGWSQDEIDQMNEDQQAQQGQQQASLAQAMLQAQRQFDAGETRQAQEMMGEDDDTTT